MSLFIDGTDKDDVIRLILSIIKKFELNDVIRDKLNKQASRDTVGKICTTSAIDEILEKIVDANIDYIEHLRLNGDLVGAQKLQSILLLASN
jgi:hypothetical protein